MSIYRTMEENNFINGVIDFKELPLMSKNKANLALNYISRNPYGITDIGDELKNDMQSKKMGAIRRKRFGDCTFK